MNNKPTLLLVDDSKNNIDILIEILGENYEIAVALDGLSALEILAKNRIDLILLDIMMPNISGFEVCEIAKANDFTHNIPVIFITAITHEDSIEKAYELGGVDYITKPFKPKELLGRVKTHIKIGKLIQNLEYISSYDTMTGILNRRKFFELSETLFTKDRENLFAIMIDIDKFKEINDTYGHHIGDQVIKSVTQTISNELSSQTIFGRIGGEEFTIIKKEKEASKVLDKMEHIRKLIEDIKIYSDDNELIQFTISNGIVQVHEDMKNIDDLVKEADKAMYQAKESGRNRSVLRNASLS
ncbi:MAG: diguanylate cyclase [Arcobacteraceae bacterium]